MKKGFTLIELLVVVLIIGILSAVALPQYQKSVVRARMAEALVATKAIYDAEQIYQMENGEYTNLFENLIIDYPISSDNPSRVLLSNGVCDLEMNRVYCTTKGLSYHRFFATGRETCCSYSDSNYIADSLCKAETGATTWYNGCNGEECRCWTK